MTAKSVPVPSPSRVAPEKGEGAPTRGLAAVTGRVLLKAFLIGAGLLVGGFLGLLIAVFSGLIDFAC